MNNNDDFRDRYPAAWMFQNNTARWPHNTLEPDDQGWPGAAFKEYTAAPLIALPPPRPLVTPLADAIRGRVSCRRFTAEPLPLAYLATMLDLAYGVHGTAQLGSKEHLERPVPSGGGLYPLEWYLIVRDVQGLPAGVYHYAPLSHALEQLKILAFSQLLTTQLFMNQPYVSEANAILVLSAVVERSLHKYADRGFRYILLEAGHAAQNVCLVATALGLGALPLGGFFDTYVGELLGIDVEQEPILYALAVGTPASDDRVEVRNITALFDG